MPKSWITQNQILLAATATVIYFVDWKGMDIDPAFVSILASGLAAITTIGLRHLQKNAEKLTAKAVSYSEGAKTAEISELKALVVDQREQMHKAGVKFVIADGINE